MADTKKEILMRLEQLIDAISSKPQVQASLLSVLREITRLMGQKEGSPSHIQSMKKPPGSNQRKNNLDILIDLVGKTVIEVYRNVWDTAADTREESFTAQNTTQKDENIQRVAQIIHNKYTNTAEGREFDDKEWQEYTYTVLEKLFTPNEMMLIPLFMEILNQALKMRSRPR